MIVRTRFAPSPTGYLHIGGVRTALYNWLFARQAGGQFILRIDDTDQQRHVEESLQPILDGFRWLGLEWDEGPEVGGPCGPYFQSLRGDRYRQAIERLLACGAAYRDYSTSEEYQQERQAAEAARQPFVYSRRWGAESGEQAAAFERQGRRAVVRLKMPRSGRCEFTDGVRGEMAFDWALEADHVVQRADGSFLYNLATVVDDIDFRITHVIRSVEHLSNTPRQLFIFQALQAPRPHFSHLPYVAEPGSQNKLSKRKIASYLKHRDFKSLFDQGVAIARRLGRSVEAESFNPVLVDFYQTVGYLPEAVLNYLLLLGWSLDDRTEHFHREEMIRHFSLERVIKSSASFDPQKLAAFQLRHMEERTVDEKLALALPFLHRAGWVAAGEPVGASLARRVIQAAGPRISVAGSVLDYGEFFVPDEALEFDAGAFEQRLVRAAESRELLAGFAPLLAEVEDFSAAALEARLHEFAALRGVKINAIVHALRVAVTGKAVGFGLFETLEILGPRRCANRIRLALQRVSESAALH